MPLPPSPPGAESPSPPGAESPSPHGADLKIGIGGFGTIGAVVGDRLDAGIPGLRLVAVSARDRDKALRRMADYATPVPVTSLGKLAHLADVVVECAPATCFREVAEAAVVAGRILIPLSVGALLDHPDLIEMARETGARIMVPTGALIGLDTVRAAAEGTIHSVTMVTRKPPKALAGSPYLIENAISVEGLKEPLRVFKGTARNGARGFPANVNVAAALSLAGIGPDETRLEIWADPSVDRNTHVIRVDSDSAQFEMTISNVPTEENPRTGRIVAQSVIAALKGLVGPLKVGT